MSRGLWQRSRPVLIYGGIVLSIGILLVLSLFYQAALERALGRWWWIAMILLAEVLLLAPVFLMNRRARPSMTRQTSHPAQSLDDSARQLPRMRDLQRLFKVTVRLAVRRLGAQHAAIYIEEDGSYRLAAQYGRKVGRQIHTLEADGPLVQWLTHQRRPLDRLVAQARALHDDKKHVDPFRRLHLILDNLQAELVVPAFRVKHLYGFVAVGVPSHGRTFSEPEIRALARLAQACAKALGYARSYEELKTNAQKLYSAQERLVRQERMVAAGRLAMGLAHEIKNPLAAIKTFAEFLPERFDDPQFREEFTHIVGKEVDRINLIVESLSEFSKPLLKVEPVDVQQILNDTIALLSSDCLKREVTVQRCLAPLPILVPADASQLKQAFLNLCVNALDAMPRGGELAIACCYKGSHAMIRISDTGVGIPNEHVPRLFDPFFSTKDSSMGLGLSIVKQIIDQHFGSIHVESQVGAGTTFEIRLPWAMELAVGTSPAKEKAGDEAIKLAVPVDLLIVDDEPRIRDLLREHFEALGCRVRGVPSGEQALTSVAAKPPQLILLDLKLEDEMDGFEVLQRVKTLYPSLPVIVITGTYNDEATEQRVREMGAVACLHKPLQLPLLHRHIAALAQVAPQANGTGLRALG